MPFLGKSPQAGNYILLDSITTSATATYNLTRNSTAYFPASARNLIVSLNGITQAPDTAYSVSGSTITFASALTSSDVIDYILVLGDVLSIGTPADNTVGESQLNYPLTNFASTGIDDNATSTAITLDGSQNVDLTGPYLRRGNNSYWYASGTSSDIYAAYSGTSDTGSLGLYGGRQANTGAGIVLYGDDHASYSNQIRFVNGNFLERLKIDSSGNVNIGPNITSASMVGGTDTNPTLTIGGADSTIGTGDKAGSIAFRTTDTTFTADFSDGVCSEIASVSENSTGGDYSLCFYTGYSSFGSGRGERMRILSGGGITFNGDTSYSNALDDYEEGTWTPVLRTSNLDGSYTAGTVQAAKYTKIGNVVYYSFYCTGMSQTTAGTGTMQIGGLPFNSVSSLYSGGLSTYGDTVANGRGGRHIVQSGTSYLRLLNESTGGDLAATAWSNVSNMIIVGMYWTA